MGVNEKPTHTNPLAGKPNASKDDVAKEVATKHFELDAGLTHIFRLQSKAAAETTPVEPIKLLEVNENTVPSGVLPLYFAADATIPYPCVIIAVTPDEFEKIKSKELKLPKGWKIGAEFSRPVEAVGAE